MGPNVHESHFIRVVEVLFTRWEPSPALCSASRAGHQRWEEKPTWGGSHGHTNQKLWNKWVQICALVKEKRHQLWSQTDLGSSLGSATYYIHDLRQIIHSLRLNVLTFKIGTSGGWDGQHSDDSYQYFIVYLKVARRVDLKCSHHKKKIFVTMRDDEC